MQNPDNNGLNLDNYLSFMATSLTPVSAQQSPTTNKQVWVVCGSDEDVYIPSSLAGEVGTLESINDDYTILCVPNHIHESCLWSFE